MVVIPNVGEIRSPSPDPDKETKPHTMKSKFDSDPESDSEDEQRLKRKSPSSSSLGHARGGYSGYHDTVMSEEEQSDNELTHEQPGEGEDESEERHGDKESMLCCTESMYMLQLMNISAEFLLCRL